MPEDTTVSRLGVVNDVAEVTKPAAKKGAVEKNANMTPGDDGLYGSEGVYGAAGVVLSEHKVLKLRNGIMVENN